MRQNSVKRQSIHQFRLAAMSSYLLSMESTFIWIISYEIANQKEEEKKKSMETSKTRIGIDFTGVHFMWEMSFIHSFFSLHSFYENRSVMLFVQKLIYSHSFTCVFF